MEFFQGYTARQVAKHLQVTNRTVRKARQGKAPAIQRMLNVKEINPKIWNRVYQEEPLAK